MFNFNFVSFAEITHSDALLDWFSKPQKYNELTNLQITSSSSITNNYNLITTLLLTLCSHALFLLISKLNPCRNITKCKGLRTKIHNKLFEYFTLGVYIRLIIEAYQYLLI